MIELIQHNHEELGVNRIAVEHLGEALNKLRTVISRDHAKTKFETGAIYTRHIILQVKDYQNQFLNVIKAAMMSRLAPGAITKKAAQDSLENIKRMAAAKNLEPIITHLSQFHELPTTYVLTEKGFTLFIHIHLLKKENIFTLHKHLPFPTKLTDSLTATISSDYSLLALGKDTFGKTLFVELSQLELSLCHNYNSVKICPHSSQVIKTEKSPSCLFDLYFSNHHSSLKTCKVYLKEPENMAIPLSKTKFLTFTKDPMTYDLICQNQPTKAGLQLFGTQTLDIPQDCFAKTKQFDLYPQNEMYFTEENRIRKWTLPPSNFWGSGMDERDLNQTFSLIKKSVGLPKIQPLDLSLIKSLHDPLHTFHTPNVISLSVCAILFILLATLVGLIIKAYRRESKAPSCPQQNFNLGAGTNISELYPMINNAKA